MRIKHLPTDSATGAVEAGNGWTLLHYLTADVFSALAGQHHPHDPRVKRKPAVTNGQLRAAKARHDERRKRLGITGSVLAPRIDPTPTE